MKGSPVFYSRSSTVLVRPATNASDINSIVGHLLNITGGMRHDGVSNQSGILSEVSDTIHIPHGADMFLTAARLSECIRPMYYYHQ